MKITDIRVRKIENGGKMKAVVSITIDEEFVVHDIKIIEGEKGLFIAMPSRKTSDCEFKDVAHPIKSSTREELQRIILERYEKEMAALDAVSVAAHSRAQRLRFRRARCDAGTDPGAHAGTRRAPQSHP